MIKIYNNPSEGEWTELVQRPMEDNTFISGVVKNIINRVGTVGDEALKTLTEQYDKVKLSSIHLEYEKFEECDTEITSELKSAIDQAYKNIKKFHSAQKPKNITIDTMPGVNCQLIFRAIETVGLYIPGGSAPLFSTVLMLGIPAQIAGCENIYLCSPPDKTGNIHPAICYAAKKCGISKIYKVGGAQAIAAMAYGTESIPKADKIFGPGNQYVTLAKQLVSLKGVAIDMPAGPSELSVFADETSNPDFIAADLLSQAEHGIDSQVMLVCTNASLIDNINFSIGKMLNNLPRRAIAEKALNNSKAVIFENVDEAFRFLNLYAPEHLIIASHNSKAFIDKVKNAGSVFLGNLTPESAGDYASGTNHTLPTNGTARAFSGITLMSFMKTITFQELTREGVVNLAPIVEIMAENEHLAAHRLAMELRRKSI